MLYASFRLPQRCTSTISPLTCEMLWDTRSTSSLMRASSRPGSNMIVVSYVFMKVSLLNRVQSESVPTVHCLAQAGCGRVIGRARSSLECLGKLGALLLVKARQHVLGKIRRPGSGSDPDPQSRKLGRPHLCEDRLQSLMSARAARGSKTDRSQGQVHVVEHDQDFRGKPPFPDQLAQRLPAAIHVGLWLRHRDFVPAGAALAAEHRPL